VTLNEILVKEGKRFPGKTYAEVVLSPAYENAKKFLLKPMLSISKAHLIMLVEQGLLPRNIAIKIAEAIKELDLESIQESKYDGSFEDLFFCVEKKIMDKTGEVGGSLHIARSRNDMGVAMYRMVLREKLLLALKSMLRFQETLLDVAKKHRDTIVLGYTHTQQAQPMTFAHYMIAVHDSVSRDVKRFLAAYKNCNLSPLGAVALTTTGFPINRERVAQLLGFNGIVENAYDAISGADYLGESASVVKLALIDLGRFIQDLLIWSTQEFSAIYVADPYVQISSIMPQKRNPVSLEHIRALSSSAVGSASTVLQMIHNTPFGDINDTEDDLQPYLWNSLELAEKIFRLSTVVIGTIELNKELLLNRAKDSFATITELADTLVRELNIPFRTSHSITRHLVEICLLRKIKPSEVTTELLDEAAKQVIGRPLLLSGEALKSALDPVHFVKVRSLTGGPAPEEIDRLIRTRQELLREKRKKIEAETKRITECLTNLDDITEYWSQAL